METTKSYDTIYLNDLYMVPQEDVPTHVPQIYYVNEISSADQDGADEFKMDNVEEDNLLDGFKVEEVRMSSDDFVAEKENNMPDDDVVVK
ncbi:hypothetical protein F2Q70_00011562 [Brassica cretica]|uniref:Uncharacterized protein n=2 Tax=Brassica cretica TaxID=69181 RepID=A0A8S9JF02_BRACR|nr:hypothetical protein F2Q68_00004673 [Brassica cretica]KAF2610169.1 hypothetical protein F2Q70_00011562 [Brassica cretica]KAF3510776.1 hypothetical protein F2Q69_00006210 [Brassica cretica]KAF3549863.1 hypothetical protein DY000_02006938 [Brassica cretica]